jgi:hypothetical protein
MKFRSNLDEQECGQEHLDACFADSFAMLRIEEAELCCDATVGDNK